METYSISKTARTWDSYRDTLIRIIGVFNPMSVLEYGPGESTKIMQDHQSISLIDTIEHNNAWASKANESLNHKVKIYSETDDFKYPYFKGRCDKYDLIFVDGLKRPECLMVAKFRLHKNGIVILHDAERPEYKKAIDTYNFKFFTDDNHTVVLTNEQQTAISISEILW